VAEKSNMAKARSSLLLKLLLVQVRERHNPNSQVRQIIESTASNWSQRPKTVLRTSKLTRSDRCLAPLQVIKVRDIRQVFRAINQKQTKFKNPLELYRKNTIIVINEKVNAQLARIAFHNPNTNLILSS